MGFNVYEQASGPFSGDLFTFTLDLGAPNDGTVSGDIDAQQLFAGFTEAPDGYTFTETDTTFGSLTTADTTTGAFTFTVDAPAVFDTNANQVFTFTVEGANGATTDDATVQINLLICVARGTRLEGDAGEVAVEDLRIGDRVRLQDGRMEPVRWIGSRRVEAAELAHAPDLRPVVIKRGALGAGQPRRDLRVSPQHRVLVMDDTVALLFGSEQVLAPAKGLVNGKTVQIDAEAVEVEYFHILFDKHEVMLTEGLPTESFYPGTFSLNALDAEMRAELFALFPDLAQRPYGAPAARGLRPWEAQLLVQATGPAH
ncbi:MAG: Hint domain-containing protein [Pseudomonadota bacterium]